MVVRCLAKKLRSTRPIKRSGHYCELFMCRDGFTILALDYAISLNRFILCYIINKSLNVIVVFLQPVLGAYLDIFTLFPNLVLHLASRCTSQPNRVCTVHLTLTLSSSGLSIRIFSSF